MAQFNIPESLSHPPPEHLASALEDLEEKWAQLPYAQKQQEFDQITKDIHLLKNSQSHEGYENDNEFGEEEHLNEIQNRYLNLKAEIAWEFLKNEPDFMCKKFFLCLPTLSKSEKTLIGRKITENSGFIKTSPTEADFIIVNEGVFKGEGPQRMQEQSKIFTHMNSQHHERMDQQYDISKSINFIHESNFKSRLAKLVTQAPKKSTLEMNRQVNKAKSQKYENVFEFLSNKKWMVITLNDLYDVFNRQESSKRNLAWFRKRLRPIIKDYGDFNYSTLFLAASFYRMTDCTNREMDHKVFYDEFLEAEPIKEVNKSSLEYMKKNSLVGM